MQIAKTETTLKISIAFELKDIFKSFFKTAKWNAAYKVWEVANTTANMNKLDKFAAASVEAETALKTLENQEATQAEIDNLVAQAAELAAKTQALVAANGAQNELAKRLEAAKAVLATATAEAATAADAAQAAARDNVETLDAVLAPFTLGGQSVKAVIKQTFAAYTKRDRDMLDKNQAFLREVYETVKTKSGVEFTVILEVARANINRVDRDKKWFYADVYAPEFVTVA